MRGFTFRANLPNKDIHICIIINELVKHDDDIIYFFMTSQEDKVMALRPMARKGVLFPCIFYSFICTSRLSAYRELK